MQISAAVLRQSGSVAPFADSLPLTIEQLELREPSFGEVLVKIAAAGLCHSDLSVITGDRPRPVPMALGHEASGYVVKTGPGVTDLQLGDLVVLVFVPSCGHCLPCMEGRPALCEPGAKTNAAGVLAGGGYRLYCDGSPVHHHLGVSAFADHAVVARNSCVKIRSDMDPVKAALFGCAVLTGVGAAVNTGAVKAGMTTAVVGLGGVGMCTLLGCLAAGARSVIAMDLNLAKLELALSLGATAAIDAAEGDAVGKIRELTSGGVDVAFEMAGSVRAMQTAYEITRRGGTTVTAGLPNPKQLWNVSTAHMVAEERSVKGSYIGSCVPLRDIPRYMDLFRQGRLPVDRLLGRRLKLEDINEGFDRLADGGTLRDIVVF